MEQLLKSLRSTYPSLHFRKSTEFYWSPKEQIVYYTSGTNITDTWTLLHETSHGILQHTTFKTDFELLRLEIAAWEFAKTLAQTFNITIDEDHIEDCLDTYRDWLHKRSLCPTCGVKSLQINERTYGCINCSANWRVSTNRLCRPYRTTLKSCQM